MRDVDRVTSKKSDVEKLNALSGARDSKWHRQSERLVFTVESVFSKPPLFWHLKFWCVCEVFSSTGAANVLPCKYLRCHFIELFRCLCLKLKNSPFPMNRQRSLLSRSVHKPKVILSRRQSTVTNFGLFMFSVGHFERSILVLRTSETRAGL